VSYLIHRLVEDLYLSEKDCRAVISRYFAQQILSTTQSVGFSEKMMMTPEVIFGQDSTQKLSEKVGSESLQNQAHQVLSLPEPYSNISSSDEDQVGEASGRSDVPELKFTISQGHSPNPSRVFCRFSLIESIGVEHLIHVATAGGQWV
jgi:hypothetical protein